MCTRLGLAKGLAFHQELQKYCGSRDNFGRKKHARTMNAKIVQTPANPFSHIKPASRSLPFFFLLIFPYSNSPYQSGGPLQHEEKPHERKEEKEESIHNASYWNKKIHTLCTTNQNVDEALRLLDRLRFQGYRPNFLNLSSIIHALCNSNRFMEAHQYFFLSIASHFIPDERTCNVLIARLLDSRMPRKTLLLLNRLSDCKPEFVPSLINYNRLIDQLCSSSHPVEARRLFSDMRIKGHSPDIVSYTTLINGYCKMGELDIAQELFDEMCEGGLVPNSLTYSVIIGGALRQRKMEHAKELMTKLWQIMEKNKEDPFVKNAAFVNLIHCLCKEGFINEVFSIAENMPQRNNVPEEFAYGQMIDALCRVGRNHGASRIVYLMRKKGLIPSLVTYNFIIHGLSKDGGCMRAYQLLKEGVEFGYMPSEHTYKVLIEALCKESDLCMAKELLQLMLNKEDVDKIRICNIYLRALSLINSPTELLNVLVFMLQNECRPDVVSLNTIINGFCKMGRTEEALKVLNDMMIGKFCAPDSVTFTTVIFGLLNEGRVEDSMDLLHREMPEKGFRPNIVTYNAVLKGLFQQERADEAMTIFQEMESGGVEFNSVTCTIIIDGLAYSNRIEEAKRFWDEVIWPSKIHDDFVYAALLKGLCRSGNFHEACHFLYELVDCGISPNIVNYNILIDHACKLGLKKEAYQIFGEMKKNGIAPDAVTWRILDKLHGNARKLAPPLIN